MVKKNYNLSLIGLGTVGSGFLDILSSRKHEITDKYDLNVKVVSVSDTKGTLYDQDGLEIEKILRLKSEDLKNPLKSYDESKFDKDSYELVFESNSDVLVETTPTNLEDGEPGLSNIKKALNKGKDVITTNKGPISLEYQNLYKLSQKNQVKLMFEGTVLAGTPAINFIKKDLAGSNIKSVRGILNGTTNYILSKMEKESKSFDKALEEAQKLGYAESDPSADIDGWDAAAKVSILSNVIFDQSIDPSEVLREGIRNISLEDVKNAEKNNKRIKLIGKVNKKGKEIKTSVKPVKLSLNDSLAQVMDATNAISVNTDHLGEVSVIGPGAGKKETGQAVLNDLLRLKDYR